MKKSKLSNFVFSSFLFFLTTNSFFSFSQTFTGTPPSCVITFPHCNSYFQEGSTININVYARDVGGSFANGSVTKVEFFNGAAKLGEDLSAPFTFEWVNVDAGTYTITAKAMDNDGNVSTSAGIVVNVGSSAVTPKGMSSCKGKYLGNIIANSIRSDYNDLWNAVTAENGCKWGSVEATRNVFNWTVADLAYNHAMNNNMPFRYHAIAWGSQYPSWITSLSPAEFKTEMEEYMAAIAARYPLIDQIDVLNEALRTHAPGTDYFRNGLGGANGGVAPDNNTGFDWVVWLFRKAREYFPNAKLVLNDYGLENDATAINEMLQIVKVLRDRNLIDGFGTQAHTFNVDGLSSSFLQERLDQMGNGGIPVYVTELDMTGSPNDNQGTESTQLNSYQNLFPVFWNHPHVAGISLWGYVEGQTWRPGTGLLRSDGSEKPAMVWLKQYMSERPDAGYPFCSSGNISQDDNLLMNGEFDNGIAGWEIQNNAGGNGSMSVVTNANMSGSNALRICPSTPGTADWHVQVRQNAPFEAGKQYTISFMAKADAARSINIGIQQEGNPWTIYFGQPISLTSSLQTFTFNFTPNITDATAKLKFFAGANSTCIYIDKVVFRENLSPSVSISSPANNTSFCQGTPVIITADADDDDGSVSKVEFYSGATLLGSVTSSPYNFTWVNPGAGTHSITARATDNGNATTTSSAISITVNSTPAPGVTSTLFYCENSSSSPLTATGSNLQWYTSSSGGTGSADAPVPETGSPGTTYHYVSQTVNSCESARASIAVTVNVPPSIADAGEDQHITSHSATLSANVPVHGTGSWSLISGSGNISNPSNPSATVSSLSVGANIFQWTISNGGCTPSIDQVTINAEYIVSVIKGTTAFPNISLFPNPFSDEIRIRINTQADENLFLIIMDLSGKIHAELTGHSTNQEIILGRNLPPGMYMIQAICNEKTVTGKFEKLN